MIASMEPHLDDAEKLVNLESGAIESRASMEPHLDDAEKHNVVANIQIGGVASMEPHLDDAEKPAYPYIGIRLIGFNGAAP